MKIPKKLKIGGHIYRVELIDPEELDEGASSGWENNKRNFIKIREDLPQSQKEATLLHEILHAINIELEHKDVEFLAQTLYQVLKDNKLLIQ